GLLLQADGIDLQVGEADTGQQRALLKAVRFRGLLATVQQTAGGRLRLRIDGPGSVLDQAQRYGQQLAQLLPAIACLPGWRLQAHLRPPKRESRRLLQLELDQQLGLRGESRYLSTVPEELRLLAVALQEQPGDWSVDLEPPPIPLGDGELLVADLALRGADGASVLVEFFHRWHASALERRLQQVTQRPELPVVIGVDRSLAKRPAIAPLLTGTVFAQRGFCYSGYPGVRLVTRAVRTYLGAFT
ncbi:MAG: DUF790 family protein, partial [Planctomycetota bacterium]